MNTLTNGVATITPDALTVYSTTRKTRTIVHDILDRPDPDVSFQTAATRAGTLELVIVGETASAAAETLLAAPGTWTLATPGRLTLGMVFVVAGGDIERTPEPSTGAAWLVRVPFREVTP